MKLIKNIIKSILSLVFVSLIFSCEENTEIKTNQVDSIFCGAEEEVVSHENGLFFKSNDSLIYFSGVESKSDEFAFEGNHSIKLDSVNLYGFSTEIKDYFEVDNFVQVSVWEKESEVRSVLIAVLKGEKVQVIESSPELIFERKNGWKKHQINFVVDKPLEIIQFYVFSDGKTTYFDNFELKKHDFLAPIQDVEVLDIHIPEKSQEKLNIAIQSSLESGIISAENKKYLKSKILVGKDSIPSKIRLKGDWADHLSSWKTSFRIKISGNNSFKGLKTFSIQHPSTRNYMHEWFMHQLFNGEDLLSTHYELIPVVINDKYKGVYALEEHFDKQLLEIKKRREGPILKIDESGFWGILLAGKKEELNNAFPYYYAAVVSTFKQNRTLKSKSLKKQYMEGISLLNLFKNDYEKPEEIFDIDLLAKYYALLEIGNVSHGHAWHNRRFYFNSVTHKLEHIGFDMQPGSYNFIDETYVYKCLKKRHISELSIDKMILRNIEFREKYTQYLKKYSSIDYLDSMFNHLNQEISFNENLLQAEIQGYYFDKDFYYKRCEIIRNHIPQLDSIWDVFMNDVNWKKNYIHSMNYQKNENNFYINEISLNTYTSYLMDSTVLLEFENYHLNGVKIIGYEYGVDSVNLTMVLFDSPVVLNNFNNQTNVPSTTKNIKHYPTKILFKIDNNLDTIIKKNIIPWSKPSKITSRIQLERNFKQHQPNLFTIENNQLIFNKGKLTISEILLIPKQLEVIVLPGTEIDFVKGGGLIINNSFYAEGKPNEKIIFDSSDGDNHGILVMNGKEAKLNHVEINQLQNIHYKNWEITGALTFYQTPVNIENVLIQNNMSEDALNIIRSEFFISELTIKNTKSDGFDADFATGTIQNSYFEKAGNDAIDFSGSEITIKNVNINHAVDKGISAGERTTLIVENVKINHADIGIASKDDSHVTVSNTEIHHVKIVVTAYQKKSEYGISSMIINDLKASNFIYQGLIEKGSFIKFKNLHILGLQTVDIEEMYAAYEK